MLLSTMNAATSSVSQFKVLGGRSPHLSKCFRQTNDRPPEAVPWKRGDVLKGDKAHW